MYRIKITYCSRGEVEQNTDNVLSVQTGQESFTEIEHPNQSKPISWVCFMSGYRSILNFITAICYVIHDNALLWTEDHNVYTSVQNIADRVTGNTNKLFNDKLIIGVILC